MNQSPESLHPVSGMLPIEDLVTRWPDTAGFLMRRSVRCLACGEPVWGTLEDAAAEKGITGAAFDELLTELRAFIDTLEEKNA